MGIRVHKMVGFGARGFNPPANFHDRCEEAYETTLGAFTKWCRVHQTEIEAFVPDTKDFRRTMFPIELGGFKDDKQLKERLNQYFVYEGEFGFKDGIVFIPPGEHLASWQRHDTHLDWSEETQLHDQNKRWVPLDREFNPFSKGKPPLTIAALCLWLGVPEVFPRLEEALYVYWA